MAMNQILYLTNPDNASIGIVAGNTTPVNVIVNATGEPFKVIGLKVNMNGATQDIAVDLGSGTPFTLVSGASGIVDLLPLLPFSLDTAGNKFILIPAGVTLRVDANTVSAVIMYTYESYVQ